jgi:hypothetical protein
LSSKKSSNDDDLNITLDSDELCEVNFGENESIAKVFDETVKEIEKKKNKRCGLTDGTRISNQLSDFSK